MLHYIGHLLLELLCLIEPVFIYGDTACSVRCKQTVKCNHQFSQLPNSRAAQAITITFSSLVSLRFQTAVNNLDTAA